ncbi:O-antigen ligase family protein [Mucilaginibacter sp. AW1-3]
MRKLLLIDDTLANKISFYHLLLLLVSLPFDYFFSHVILVSFAIHTLIHLKKSEVKPIITLRTLVLQSVFLVTLIATTYSPYKNQAVNDMGREIVILLIPILFCLNPLNIKKYRARLLTVFGLCCTLTVVYLYVHAVYLIRYFHYPIKFIFSHAFTNHNFSDPIGMHATFLSLQVGIAIICLLTIILKPATTATRIFYSFCCLILLAGLIQLSSKSVVAVMLLTVDFVVPFFLLTGRRRITFMAGSIAASLLMIMLLFHSVTFKERYFNSFSQDLSQRHGPETTDSRVTRWGIVIQLIRESPVIGHGSGSEIILLKEAFFKNKLYDSFLNGLNSHNQYLSFLLKSGICGLLIYLFTLAYGFNIAFKTTDVVFITFMLLIAIVSLSENIFDVDKGTMFYGLFYPLFVFSERKAAILKRVSIQKNILANGQPVC